MIKDLDEAIVHCKHKAEENRAKIEIKDIMSCEDIAEFQKDCEDCAADHDQLASWLEELAERREADRWIPVSERLPEYRHAVLVYCPENKNVYCAFHDDKHWCVFGSYETVWQRVTHWKPLPKAPEGEDKRTCSLCGWCQTSDNQEDPEDTLVCANGACEHCGRLLGTLSNPIEIENCDGFEEPL